MAGFTPDEAELLIRQIILSRSLGDRDANLELGLFTDVAPGETITEATISEPTGGGYARIDLIDANWNHASNPSTYAQQTFTAGVGGFTGAIAGYFIATKSSLGTKRLIVVEIDTAGPFTITQGSTYKVTPTITGL